MILVTSELDFPDFTNPNRTQSFQFNFKSNEDPNGNLVPIFPSSTLLSNIRVSVYLSGIKASSETIQNGYPTNYNFFSLDASIDDTLFYRVNISIRSSFGDVLIT